MAKNISDYIAHKMRKAIHSNGKCLSWVIIGYTYAAKSGVEASSKVGN